MISGLIEEIARTDGAEIGILLKAVLQRYAVLFPEWELSIIALQKDADRNEQIEQMITLLQKMKTAR